MKYLLAIASVLLICSCAGSKSGHTVNVKKPIYHHSWYKNHKWHKKLHVGRVRLRLFEKQGARTVKMKG